jgi:hypothetical protein
MGIAENCSDGDIGDAGGGSGNDRGSL